MSERKYSKAKAVANHVVWTAMEIIPVVFNLDGLVHDQGEFGIFRVPGRDMYCTGFRIDFQVPAGDYEVRCAVGLYTANDYLVPTGLLRLDGVTLGDTKTFNVPLPMPVNSVWKFKMEVSSPTDQEEYFPQGISATYYLRYAAGPVSTQLYTYLQPSVGVGFDTVGTTLIVD